MLTTRKYQGFDVPKLDSHQMWVMFGVKQDDPIYRGEASEFEWLFPLIADSISTSMCLRVLPSGKEHIVTTGRLDRLVRAKWGVSSYLKFLKLLQYEVPGQVKNFLVAVRTSSSCDLKDIKVLIRGSKSGSGSGIWIWLFSDYLSHKYDSVIIDCYDPLEVPKHEVRTVHRGDVAVKAEINHYAKFYYGTGEEYDVCVDDAYLQGTVPWNPKSVWWSLKCHDEGVFPFLHSREGRKFSHVVVGIDSPCPCMVCKVIAESVACLSDFILIKSASIILDGASCNLVDHALELQQKGDLFKKLCSAPVVNLVKPQEFRAALALSSDILCDVLTPSKIRLTSFSSGDPLIIVHKMGFSGGTTKLKCDVLEGKPVSFYGVDPTILGDTKTYRPSPGDPNGIVFAVSASILFKVGYYPSQLWTLDQEVVGYSPTGYEWSGYHSFRRRKVQVTKNYSEYSLAAGIDVRGMEDIIWTKDTPNTYRVTIEQALSLSVEVDGWHEGKFTLKHPFRVDMKGDELPPDPNFNFVVDSESNDQFQGVEVFDEDRDWKISQVQCRGGLFFILPRTSNCFYYFRDNVLTSSPCMHDHVLRSGNCQIVALSQRLCGVEVWEQGTMIKGRFINNSHQVVSDHYEFHRPWKKVVGGVNGYTIM